MFQIVRRHVKYVKMCQVLRHAKMCNDVIIHAKGCQGNKKENKLSYKEMNTQEG